MLNKIVKSDVNHRYEFGYPTMYTRGILVLKNRKKCIYYYHSMLTPYSAIINISNNKKNSKGDIFMKTIKLLLLLISLTFTLSNVTMADTIHITLPSDPQKYCQTLGFDTFVIHKPMGWGSTLWYIEVDYVGVGDSLIYIPTALGTFDITARYDANSMLVVLRLDAAPPAHANFTINTGPGPAFGSGTIANDTLWMCSDSIMIRTNVINTEASYSYWGGAGGYSTDPTLHKIKLPGIHFFERGNGCGAVRDSLVVVKLPSSLPSLGADTAFCNTPVSLTLDAGPGWNYSWNTGDHTQTIAVTTAGTYTVTLNNNCTSGGVISRTISHESYPLPGLGFNTEFCYGQIITLVPHPTYTYDSYTWSNGATSDTLAVTETGVFTVTVTDGMCSAVSNTTYPRFIHPYADNSLCIITVDPVLGKNKIVWEPDLFAPNLGIGFGIVSYNIYKLKGAYTLIGNVPNDNVPALYFIDTLSNPITSAARYKITAVDTCGNESDKGYGMGTIKINANPGMGGVVDLTVADLFWDESGTYSPLKYYILIDSLNNGINLAVLDSIDAVFKSYTVSNPYPGATYFFGIAFPWACGDGRKTLSNMSFSNKSFAITTSVSNYLLPTVNLYPNPSTGIFHVEGVNISHIDVMDEMGKLIISLDNQSTIDLSALRQGVYYARFSNKQGSTSQQKLVVIK